MKNELQQSTESDELKQQIFANIRNLTEYVKKINEQLKMKLKEQKKPR